MPPETTTAVLDTLRPAQNILIITHIAPDGDAIGSLTGMGLILRQMGKNVTLACDDPVPDHLRFLPDVDAVRQPQIEGAFDLIVAVDCGDEERMGQSLTLLGNPRPPILNIDHHITNTCFGVTNLVDGTTTSTAEILFNLLPVLGVSLTPDIARSLLTGIVTDTLGFRIAGVTAQTISAASVLMEAGADLTMITMQALNLKQIGRASCRKRV